MGGGWVPIIWGWRFSGGLLSAVGIEERKARLNSQWVGAMSVEGKWEGPNRGSNCGGALVGKPESM